MVPLPRLSRAACRGEQQVRQGPAQRRHSAPRCALCIPSAQTVCAVMDKADAFRILGLSPEASDEAIKRAYRRLALACHPDRHPADSTATARFRELHEAYKTVRVRNDRHGEPDDDAHGPVFLLVNTIAGAGKTRKLAGQEARPHAGRTLIAAISIDLIREIEGALCEFGAVREVFSAHSQQGPRVKKRIQKFLRDKGPLANFILTITHTAAMDPGQLMSVAEMTTMDLVFDEIPDAVNFLRINAPRRHSIISQHLVAAPFGSGNLGAGILRLKSADDDAGDPASAYSRLRRLAINRPYDDSERQFQDLAAALIDAGRDVYVMAEVWQGLLMGSTEIGGEVDFLIVARPDMFKHFRSVTMMGARADRSLTYNIWRRLYHTRFHAHPLQAQLPTHHHNGTSLTIYYAFEERVSRAFLDKKTSDGLTMFDALALNVARFYADRLPGAEFVWSAPQRRVENGVQTGVPDNFFGKLRAQSKRADGQPSKAFDPSLRLPGRTHGLNRFRHHDHVVLLSVINFSPQQAEILSRLGFQQDELLDIFAFNVLYQDLLRGSLRDPVVRPRTGFVPDLPSAHSLASSFVGCRIERLPDQYVPVVKAASSRGPQPSGNAMSANERQRKRRERQREAARERAADAA